MTSSLVTSIFKRLRRSAVHLSKRYESHDLHYDLSEDIVTTTYHKVIIIGINLPDASNALNDTALEKLNQQLKDFNINEKYTVAVLHGIGGNFCTGIQKTANEGKAKEIIKTMSEMKKPTIATLTGFTTFFGFQLAIMCDFRVMEVGSVFGFGHGKDRGAVYPEVCKRLLALTNVSATLDFVLSGSAIHNNPVTSGLINRIVENGTGLGKSITMAATISKYPQDDILKHRDFIYSLIPMCNSKL